MNRFLRLSPPAVALGVVGLAFVASLIVLPKGGFWVVDEAGKFLQVQALARSHFTDMSIPWPGREADPEFVCTPLPFPFAAVREGRLYSIFSPAFAALSVAPYAAFGLAGLSVIPLLASLVMLVGVARLAKALELGPRGIAAAVVLAGLGTPVWFYSVTFWEHTLALAFGVWGLFFGQRFTSEGKTGDLAIAVALGAAAAWFRDEAYLLCAALALAALVQMPGSRLKAAAAAGAAALAVWVPLWVFQWRVMGHPLGMHAVGHLEASTDIVAFLKARPRVFFWQFLASHPQSGVSLALSLPFLALFVLRPAVSGRWAQFGVPAAGAAAGLLSAVTLAGYLGHGPLVRMLQSSNSLFVTAPLAILAFLRVSPGPCSRADERAASYLWRALLLFGVFYVLAAPVIGMAGIHWGNRHLLVFYPLAAVLAGQAVVRWWALAPEAWRGWGLSCLAFLVVVSVAAQVLSVSLLVRKQAFSAEANRAIRGLPSRVLVTDVWWVPQELFSVFHDRMVFYVREPGQLADVRPRLQAMGVTNFLFVTHAMQKPLPDEVMRLPCRLDPFYSLSIFRGRF